MTNGDNTMRQTIKYVFPNVSHILCSRHIHRNATENVENKSFLHEFRNLIYANFTRDEFELKWKNVVEKYKLGDNNWVKIIHQMKEK